jgi:hypothetical protein
MQRPLWPCCRIRGEQRVLSTERRTLFATDLVGTSDEILERLRHDPVLPHVSELRVELPYNFSSEDYEQILTDLSGRIALELGWRAL